MYLQDNVVEDSMTVDPRHHRHFVIRKGQVLRTIAEEYGGVMVSFPRPGTQSDKVALKGAKDCVEAAKKRILEIIDDLVSVQFRRALFSISTVCFFVQHADMHSCEAFDISDYSG